MYRWLLVPRQSTAIASAQRHQHLVFLSRSIILEIAANDHSQGIVTDMMSTIFADIRNIAMHFFNRLAMRPHFTGIYFYDTFTRMRLSAHYQHIFDVDARLSAQYLICAEYALASLPARSAQNQLRHCARHKGS